MKYQTKRVYMEKKNDRFTQDSEKNMKDEQQVPEKCKTGIVTPVFKKGCKEDLADYKAITLVDTGYKIYAENLKDRLEKEMEGKKVMSDTIIGYRKGRGTIDAVYIVKTAIEEETRKKRRSLSPIRRYERCLRQDR